MLEITMTKDELIDDLRCIIDKCNQNQFSLSTSKKNKFSAVLSQLQSAELEMQIMPINHERDDSFLVRRFKSSVRQNAIPVPFIWVNVLDAAIDALEKSDPNNNGNNITFEVNEKDFEEAVTLDFFEVPCMLSCGHVVECTTAGSIKKCFAKCMEISSKDVHLIPDGLRKIMAKISPAFEDQHYPQLFLDKLNETVDGSQILTTRLALNEIEEQEWPNIFSQCLSDKERFIMVAFLINKNPSLLLTLLQQHIASKTRENNEISTQIRLYLDTIKQQNNCHYEMQKKFLLKNTAGLYKEDLPILAIVTLVAFARNFILEGTQAPPASYPKVFILIAALAAFRAILSFPQICQARKCINLDQEITKLQSQLSNEIPENSQSIWAISTWNLSLWNSSSKNKKNDDILNTDLTHEL